MLVAYREEAGSELQSATSFSQVPYDPFRTPDNSKTPVFPNFRFLDKHPLFQRKQHTPPESLRSPSPHRSSQDTVRPSDAGREVGSSKRKYKHVPLYITRNVRNDALRTPYPLSPVSVKSDTKRSSTLTFDLEKEEDPPEPKLPPRPRHIPIEIPAFAYPLGPDFPSTSRIVFPPTPSPSISTHSTPRHSLKITRSLEDFVAVMSRPTTSESLMSTADSNHSAFAPEQSYENRPRPNPGTYLADMNSSSESSLNQAIQEAPNDVNEINRQRRADPAQASTAEPLNPGTQTPATATSATNMSGLVCNVHRCTGKEPHGRVGATTTILGDKLYVFGGRIVSRRRPYLTADTYELDLVRRHWTKLQVTGQVPPPRYFHSVCALGDSKLICYGGMSPSPSQMSGENTQRNADPNVDMVVMSDIHVFDAPTKTWTHIGTADTPPGRYAHCAAVLPSTATFASANAPLSAILHNPPSSVPNQGTLGLAIDGTGGAEMIVVGGQDSNNKYIDAVSVFNLRSLKWTDTTSLPRSCGAYRSVVTPLVGMSPMKIGRGVEQDDHVENTNGTPERPEPTSAMLIYSNYNFLDVKLELQVRMPNGSLVEKAMRGPVSPPGLRFPNGDVLDNHFIVSGTYLTSSKHEYALWALDLRSLEWSRIDAGGGIFSQGSWNRGVLWARRNTFVILGNRKRSLVEDYNHRRINFSNMCMVELEAFGLYDNPRRVRPTSNYTSISAPILPPSVSCRTIGHGGQPLSTAAVDLGTTAMNIRDLADMDLLAIGGERIPVNSYILSRRWGPYFVKLLRETGGPFASVQSDAASSSDGGTLRSTNLNTTTASLASRNSSITITPSITTGHSVAPSNVTGMTGMSSDSGATLTAATSLDPPSAQSLPASGRPRQLYLPHTLLTLRSLVHYLYTSSLPAPGHHLCTPQILCSLLQLSRPYRIEGLQEATVERLHQILDSRNATAVFNAAAMAAGGGRGTGTAFGKEGDALNELTDDLQGGLTIGRLQARNHAQAPAAGEGSNNESEVSDTSSEFSSSTTSLSNASEDSFAAGAGAGGANGASGGGGGRKKGGGGGEEGEIWAGGMSCTVGIQKRGLRGLMEGRRIREKERGRAVGGLGSPNVNGGGGQANGVGSNGGGAAGTGAANNGNGDAVGLGII